MDIKELLGARQVGLEFVFELLKKFQEQEDKDELEIINGEFYLMEMLGGGFEIAWKG